MEKLTEKQIKKFTSRMQARLLLVFCVAALMFIGLMGRLVYIMQTDGDRYAKKVLSRQSYVSAVLPYKRGEIMDRNKTILARSELRYRLILDPKDLLMYSENISPTMNALEQNFGIKVDIVQKILKERSKSQYIILQKDLKKADVDKFKKLMQEDKSKVSSVYFEEEYIRAYPYDTLASDLIGFTSAENNGYFGIEEYYNDKLNGTNGREYGYYDSSLNIERIVKKPVNGNSIISTIDANAQRIVQKHIKQFNTEFGSKNIGVLVMDPNSGEIIAMASNKEYNLNTPRSLTGIYPEDKIMSMTDKQKMKALNKLWKNDAISMNYEPGSTFKPITVASALEEDIYPENQTFDCKGGEEVAGRYIHDNHVHGVVTLGEALMKSCNVTMMRIVAKEGKDIFYRYENNFGIGQKTGIDLPGEEAGIIHQYKDLGPIELATDSFGQGNEVTMIQMASAFSSLVNGGNYYKPHIVKQIISDKGATVKQFNPILVRQTVSEKTSEFIQKYMYQTVEEGTAKGAKVPGYSIGGKTGTAEKFPRGKGNYLVSFIGAVPIDNPEAVVYVFIDEPKNVPRQDDSSIATKFASRIMTELLPAIGIYPEGKINYLLDPKKETSDDKKKTTDKKTEAAQNEDGQIQDGQTQDGQTQDGQTQGDQTDVDQSDDTGYDGASIDDTENGDTGNAALDNQNSDTNGLDNQGTQTDDNKGDNTKTNKSSDTLNNQKPSSNKNQNTGNLNKVTN